MKFCSSCQKEKPLEEFPWKNKEKGKRKSYCRECSRLYIRKHYYNNVAYYVEKAKRRNKLHRHDTSKKVFEYLSSHPCVDCGESDPIVLEFDHIDQKTKTADISYMASRQRSWSTILDEIEKCEVRCANCHRRRTAKQRGYYLYLFAE